MTIDKPMTSSEIRTTILTLVRDGRILAIPEGDDDLRFIAIRYATPQNLIDARTAREVAAHFLAHPMEETNGSQMV